MDQVIQSDRNPVVRFVGFVQNANRYHVASRFVAALGRFTFETSRGQ
ncbi:MAG: hypothetical protein QOJ64_83 [Acidobacteriota bacterium]|jgi:hypothetical protein|nr:hypothetical protein [Acidobacteriota bacterium]